MNAQDTIKRKVYHSLGGGVQFLTDKTNGNSYNLNSVSYAIPGIILSYKQFRSFNSKNTFIIFNSNLFFRKGFGSSESGGKGGGNYSEGYFELLRLDVGIAKVRAFGKQHGFFIGGGFNMGGLIYSKGEAYHTEFIGMPYYNETHVRPISSVLSPINISINIELSQRIKLIKNTFIHFGFKSQLESSEGFGAGRGFSQEVFMSYMF